MDKESTERTSSRLCSDSSGFAMTGEDLDVRRKGEEAIEGVDELGEIAPGEVGAAVAHLKEGVS